MTISYLREHNKVQPGLLHTISDNNAILLSQKTKAIKATNLITYINIKLVTLKDKYALPQTARKYLFICSIMKAVVVRAVDGVGR